MTSVVLTLLLVVLSPADTSDEPAQTLEVLSWMAGRWAGEENGVTMEEYWIEPRGGLMLGLHRDVAPSGKAFFEYLRIEATPDGIVYLASPSGRPATPFRLTEADGSSAVFSNPDHDFPQRILYRREGDTLTARIEGGPGEGARSKSWTYRLVR